MNDGSAAAGMTVDSKTRGKWPGLDERRLALLLLLVAPALFCSNMLVARATHDLFPPVALAFWRWTATLALLLPFPAAALWRHRYDVLRECRDILVPGALAIGVSGAFVYIAPHPPPAPNTRHLPSASPIPHAPLPPLLHRHR